MRFPVVIIGAGPAGLTAAYELSLHGICPLVLEAEGVVGGLARTVNYKGCHFDIGGHRFYTKATLIEGMWREVLGEDLLRRPRLSRIYYNSKFFHYPLDPWNAFFGLGAAESIRCGLSYLKARLYPQKPEDDFEAWVSNRFGRRLFEIFFRTYTEKVWGISCGEIQAEWAAQRIQGLSFASLVQNALTPGILRRRRPVIKTLIHEFYYPRRGPGMMWERFRQLVEARGGKVILGAPVEKILWKPGQVTAVQAGGVSYEAEHVISSMAIRDLIEALDPAPPGGLREAKEHFNYRDFITVVLILRRRNLFPDNWIYIHDARVKAGRIQNYKNWSPEMVPDPGTTCLGLEYFCSAGDGLWKLRDEELLELGRRELAMLGLANPKDCIDGTVLRVGKAYPVYAKSCRLGLAAVREFLETAANLQLVGRNGMHRYNNQDHSMLTALLAARNILGGQYDLWSVNADAEYLEQASLITQEELAGLEATQPAAPKRATAHRGGR